jgi:hypothetical protein
MAQGVAAAGRGIARGNEQSGATELDFQPATALDTQKEFSEVQRKFGGGGGARPTPGRDTKRPLLCTKGDTPPGAASSAVGARQARLAGGGGGEGEVVEAAAGLSCLQDRLLFPAGSAHLA